MINWIIFIVLVLLAFFLLKMDHLGRRAKLAVLIMIGLLVFFSITGFLRTGEFDLKSPRGVINAGYKYVGWVGRSIANLWGVKGEVGSLVGNAIRMNGTSGEGG